MKKKKTKTSVENPQVVHVELKDLPAYTPFKLQQRPLQEQVNYWREQWLQEFAAHTKTKEQYYALQNRVLGR